jgi:hypothetical protein
MHTGWGPAGPQLSGLPLTSRLAIGLWAIRKGLVESGINHKYGFPMYRTHLQGVFRR